MRQDFIDNVCEQAVVKYGSRAQVDMAVEEMAELTNALMKDRRNRATAEDIITEVADVLIMMNQLSFMMGRDKVAAEMERKIVRLSERMNNQ